ncbi:MAG: peptide ABC transporter substrate-binding protein [Defluviitaleaceae bacterium]|nr:peptide ABC transporter substrate-binding protein [Defluviitaleaceae bacterium]
MLLCIIFLTGCAQAEPPLPPPAPVQAPEPAAEPVPDPIPQADGVLRVAMRLPKTLNPLLNEDAAVDTVLRLIFEPLMEPDITNRPSNRLASNVNFASDGMSAIVTLADGLKWADGNPITAYDVEYSLDVLRSAPERAIYKDSVRNIAEYSVTDERNIRLGYYRPFGGSAYHLSFPVIPKHFYAGVPDVLDVVMGSGLYRFSRFEQQRMMVLEPSVDAFGNRPYISEVHALILSDREADLYAFEQGLIDLVRADISVWSRLANNKALNAHLYPTAYFDFIAFNFENAILRDENTRRAFALAIDKDRLLIDIYLNGGGMAVNAPISASSWLFEPNTHVYPFDPEKASALLADTPARVLRILVNEENEERVRIANMLRRNLEPSGVSIAIESEAFDVFEQRLADGDFDVAVAGFRLSVIPDLTFAFGTGAEMNFFSYSDPKMDELLAAMTSAPNETAYRRAASELQKFFAEELPCVSLVFRNAVVMTSEKVHGVQQPTKTNPFAGMEQWFIYE